MSASVRLVGVTKSFGRAKAVEKVSLEVPQGSFTTLLGPSGCGKTTTLRLIAGFFEPDVGEIYIGDRLVNQVPSHVRGATMVFQDYALFPHMTVWENVTYGLRLRRLPNPAQRQRAGRVLELVGLTGLEDRLPARLSGGQQQRVALARALVMEPQVLLLDEPLSNLDAKLRLAIRTELRAIQRQLGITAIYVTHDQEEARALSDYLAVMEHGQVAQWGTPWEVYYHPQTAFVADFVGLTNLLSAELIARPEGWMARIGQQEISVPSGTAPGPITLNIRPEAFTLSRTPIPGGLGGTVKTYSFLGRLVRYWLDVAGQEVVVDVPDQGEGQVMQGTVYLSVAPERIQVISQPQAPERKAAASTTAS
ncbi:MAG: ABC transporter ATP-binding protein [Deinococcus sp.]|nr:ABC transporter ATP-binding protein [Deinococcus sp.]